VKTVYFEGFGIVPHYHKDTGELAMAKIVYAVDNLIDTFPEAEVKLKVNFNGSLLEESTLANFSPLQKGKQELNYTYIPADGWEEGIYTLQLELNIGGETYITSAEKELETGTVAAQGGGSMNWPLIGGIIGAVVGIAVGVSRSRKRSY